MADKIICDSYELVAVADAIRTKTNTTSSMTIADMPAKITGISGGENLDNVIEEQDSLISQIQTALQGKAAGGGSSGGGYKVAIGICQMYDEVSLEFTPTFVATICIDATSSTRFDVFCCYGTIGNQSFSKYTYVDMVGRDYYVADSAEGIVEIYDNGFALWGSLGGANEYLYIAIG